MLDVEGSYNTTKLIYKKQTWGEKVSGNAHIQ